MSVEIVHFGPEHLEGAAEVLAAMHAANRKREPALTARYEDPAQTRALIEVTTNRAAGVVALDSDGVVGYLAPVLGVEVQERVAVVLPSGAGILPGQFPELYREMYAAAARTWVRNGFFVHFVHVAACDDAAVGAWWSLGFGRHDSYSWRDLAPLRGGGAEVLIHQVGPEAFEEEWGLRQGLRRFNASSPIMHPSVWRLGDDLERTRQEERRGMAEEANAYFLADQNGRAVGLMIFTPMPADYLLAPDGAAHLNIAFVESEARSAGIGAALANRGLEWARERGYTRCTVGYYPPNLLGARFWQGSGFKALGHVLERRLDPRIAWARG